jgi:hypothetical protein
MGGYWLNKKVFNDKNYWFLQEVDLPIEAFLEYIDKTETFINRIAGKIKKHERYLNELPKHKQLSYSAFSDYHIKKFSHQLYYNSIFIMEFSFFERKLLQLCKIAERRQKLKVSDLAGSGIVRCYSYLTKVLKLDLAYVNETWSEIIKYNQLRNIFVHYPTYSVAKTSLPINQLNTLKSIKHLQIKEEGDFLEFEITDKAFLQECAETIQSFLVTVYHD